MLAKRHTGGRDDHIPKNVLPYEMCELVSNNEVQSRGVQAVEKRAWQCEHGLPDTREERDFRAIHHHDPWRFDAHVGRDEAHPLDHLVWSRVAGQSIPAKPSELRNGTCASP
jgi:hypothetical protein